MKVYDQDIKFLSKMLFDTCLIWPLFTVPKIISQLQL